MKKILVTGHNSFVGNNLIPYLYHQGYEIYGIGRPSKSSMNSIHSNLLAGEKLGDLSDESILRDLIWKPDIVINLAASTGKNFTNLERMKLSNIKSVENLTEFVRRTEASVLIHFSTISIHGYVPDNVVSHNTGMYSTSWYGQTKLESELILKDSLLNLAIYSLRLPAILAKGAVNHWPSKILESLIKSNSVLVDNPETQFNNVVHIIDLCRFISSLMKNAAPGFSAFPISSKNPIPIKEVINEMYKITKSKSVVDYRTKLRPTFIVDDSYARTNFGYESMSTIESVSKYAKENLFDYTC